MVEARTGGHGQGHRAPCTNPVAVTSLEEADRLHDLQDKADLKIHQALFRCMGWVIEVDTPTLEHQLVKAPIMDEPPVGDGIVDDPPMGDPTGKDEPLEDPRLDEPRWRQALWMTHQWVTLQWKMSR